jgi:hypothetical protein
MRIIQRVSAWFGWTLLLVVAVLLVLEGTSAIDSAWREWIAHAAGWVTQPPLAAWEAILLGVVLGLIAVVILVAQFVPIRMSRATIRVERTVAGSTLVAPLVIRRAAVERLKDIDGIIDASPFAHERRLYLRARLERDANATEIERQARETLGESFWDMLGVPAQPVELTLTYSTALTPRSTE